MSVPTCKNCEQQLQGKICHVCGQKHYVRRWTLSELGGQFFAQLTNLEKGFLYTAKMLFVDPGQLIHDYWNGKTIPYYNPFRYMIILITINIIISASLGIDDLLQEQLQPAAVEESVSSERIDYADEQLGNWMNFLVLLLVPVTSLLTFFLFKKSKKNYAEHLIMNSFIFGHQGLYSSFTQFIFYTFPSLMKGYLIFNFLIGLIYNTYAYTKTFKETWWRVLLKSLLIGITGIIVFFTLIGAFSAAVLWISGD